MIGERCPILSLYFVGCSRNQCSPLFNIYKMLLDEFIPYHGVMYPQYTDDSLCLWQIMQCCKSQEAVRIYIGNNRFQLNSGKTEWFWIWFSDLPSLTLGGVALPQRAPMCNPEILLDS